MYLFTIFFKAKYRNYKRSQLEQNRSTAATNIQPSDSVQKSWAELPAPQQPLQKEANLDNILHSLKKKEDSYKASPIPWTTFYHCKNSICNSLPLSDPKRCVRYIAVARDLTAEKYKNAVLTCAPQSDYLPPRVCLPSYIIFSLSVYYI